MTSRIRRHGIEKIFLFPALALFSLFLYTFLHEGGHALAGVSAGAKLTGFTINFLDFSAHVSLAGEFTPAEKVANTLAGPALPLLAWLVFILVVPKRTNFALESIELAATMMFLGTLLAWVVLPLVYARGGFPPDDVTDFLIHSGAAPLGVSIAALGAYVGGWLLFFRKIGGLRYEVEQLRDPQAEVFTSEVRATLWICLGILLACILITFAANGFLIP
jgi:hypothetical protein